VHQTRYEALEQLPLTEDPGPLAAEADGEVTAPVHRATKSDQARQEASTVAGQASGHEEHGGEQGGAHDHVGRAYPGSDGATAGRIGGRVDLNAEWGMRWIAPEVDSIELKFHHAN
jgi:hypothetical protein